MNGVLAASTSNLTQELGTGTCPRIVLACRDSLSLVSATLHVWQQRLHGTLLSHLLTAGSPYHAHPCTM